MALTGKQFAISAGDYSATAVEIGGGLRRCTYAGADVLASYGEDELPPKAAGSVLTPWPNRLRGGRYTFAGQSHQLPITEISRANATHGLARWIRWAPMAVDAAAVTLAVDIPPQAGWPFELRVELTYALHPDHGLAVTAVVRNQGATAAPFGMGFHPYLSLRGGRLDEAVLPTTCGTAASWAHSDTTTRSPDCPQWTVGEWPRSVRGQRPPGCGSTRRSTTCRCSPPTTWPARPPWRSSR